MTSVLITRPLSAAQLMALSLQKLGYDAIIESLLTVVPSSIPRPQERAKAVMITSSNVFAALRKREMADLFALPCFCIGSRTAEKAREFGFCDIRHAAGDGAELARLVSVTLKDKKAAILHIAAREVDSKAQDALEGAGYRVISWPVYEAVAVTAFSPATVDLFKSGNLSAVTVFSSRSAATLEKLVSAHALETCCAGLTAICLSEAVASVLNPQIWRKIIAAPQPTEDDVIACLQAACPVKT